MISNRINWIAGFFVIFLSACTAGRMVVFQFADVHDYRKFPSHELKGSDSPFEFFPGDPATFANADLRIVHNKRHNHLDSLLEKTPTLAFLIIRNDSMLYERYFRRASEESIVPSFSVAKSYVSALLGIAIQEGKIHSVQDSVTQYLTELQGKGLENIRIIHLLQMCSGLKHQENYFNPFAGVAKYYYGKGLRKMIKHIKPETAPGLAFDYLSLNSQLLGMVVERAVGKSLTEYLQEKIWTPAGMEYDASWSIDQKKNGVEKAFCCINARAKDFARFGRLYLNKGNWNGVQIIREKWVESSTKVDASEGAAWYYQYQWWLPSKDGDFMANGHLGQYIYIHPGKNLVIVRLGKKNGDVNWPVAFRELANQL